MSPINPEDIVPFVRCYRCGRQRCETCGGYGCENYDPKECGRCGKVSCMYFRFCPDCDHGWREDASRCDMGTCFETEADCRGCDHLVDGPSSDPAILCPTCEKEKP